MPKSPKAGKGAGKGAGRGAGKGKGSVKVVKEDDNPVFVDPMKFPADPMKNTDHRFMQQIMDIGEKKKLQFNDKILDLTRGRNPLVGEETYRENPEFLVHNRSRRDPFNGTVSNIRYSGNREENLGSKVGLVTSLRQRKQLLESELARTKQVMEHKRLCLSLTNEFSKQVTLHPALEQSNQIGGVGTIKDKANDAAKEMLQNRERRGRATFSFENNAGGRTDGTFREHRQREEKILQMKASQREAGLVMAAREDDRPPFGKHRS